jgi:hypothetical protein
VNKFQDFCGKKGYSFKKFDEQTVVHFITHLDSINSHFGLIGQIKPAISLLERMRGYEKTAFTPLADTVLEAAKRRAAEHKEPVKKAGELPEDALTRLINQHLAPHWERGEKLNWHKLRTIFRVAVVKYTFCRFNCFSRLKASDFTDTGDGIKIRFQSAKNDQWHKGNSSFIMDETAVRVVRLAFQTFGFRMGDEGDNRPVNCALRKTANGWKLDGERKLSYTNATKQLRELLAETGIHAERASDKSFKMLGVTGTLEAGASLDDVMHQGRWRTLSMPLQYKLNSDNFKKNIARKVV